MSIQRLSGLIAATHTPFAADGKLNLAVVETQAQHLLHQRVTTVFIGGSTGESHSLSVEERMQLAQRWFEVTRGTAMKVIVHVGGNCLPDAQALATQAQKLGATAIAALAPSYFKPRTLADLIQWCAAIADRAPTTPFYYYDIPILTGVNLPMHEFLEQASQKVPTLAGLKFTNNDLMAYQLCQRAAGGRFDIAFGFDELLLASLAVGAKGAVGSSYNFAAPIYHRLIEAFNRSDMETARHEQFKSIQLIQTLARVGYLGAAKAVMSMLGVDVGQARQPNTNPDAVAVTKLRQDLEALGFFDWIQ